MNEEKPPRGFSRFRRKAEDLARDSKAASELLEVAMTKARKGGIDQLREQFLDMIRMVKAYVRGDYRRIPWSTLVTALAAALYFVNPFDVIPDFLVGVGLLDDAAVISFCLRALQHDMTAYLEWEKRGDTP